MDALLFDSALATGRILIGIVSIVAIDRAAALFGFPRAQITPTMRLFSRLFGIRDLGLGALVFATMTDPPLLRFVLLFNAAHDLLDAVAIGVPLLRRQGIDRPARIFLACSVSGIALFLLAWWLAGNRAG